VIPPGRNGDPKYSGSKHIVATDASGSGNGAEKASCNPLPPSKLHPTGLSLIDNKRRNSPLGFALALLPLVSFPAFPAEASTR
jgi:hypothetical protein